MSAEIPVETLAAIEKIVRQVLERRQQGLGRRFTYARDFAVKYYYAVTHDLRGYKQDLLDAYSSWGLDPEVLEEIAELLEKRYGKKKEGE
jgi:hypothetical protein